MNKHVSHTGLPVFFLAASLAAFCFTTPARSQSVRRVGPEKLVFIDHVKEEDGDIYVMNADGSGIVNLTKSDEDEQGPVWSPDGKQIAYVVVAPSPPIESIERGTTATIEKTADICVMNADGSERRQLTQNSGKTLAATAPCWSPDGRLIAFSVANFAKDQLMSYRIYTMDVNGGNLKELGQGSNPIWSPDGTKILYTSGNPALGNIQLCVMDANGLNTRILAANAGLGSWAPDGKKIAYVSGNLAKQQADIFTMNADGSQKKRLTKTVEAELGPQWSNDGRRIFYTAIYPMTEEDDDNSKTAIFVMNADGKNKRGFPKAKSQPIFGVANSNFPATLTRY